MTLTQLRYFQAACELGNITLAARQLHISQPSVSLAIKSLEDEFGLSLLERSGRSFALTAEGAAFLEQAGGLLLHADEFQRSMRDMSAAHRTVRLGIPPMIGTLLLPHIYAAERASGKELQLTVAETGGNELLEQLRDHRIDMAFLPHAQPIDGRFRSLPVLNLETVCCIPAQHRLAQCASVSAADLAGEPLALLFRDGSFHNETILQRFRWEGITPNILIQSAQFSTVQKLVAQGYAAGFFFRPIAESMPGMAVVSLSPPLTVKVSLVWNKGSYLSKACTDLLDLVRHFDFEEKGRTE